MPIPNNQILYTAQRRASEDSQVIVRKIQELEQWLIFPFVITNGVLPLTESGYKPINSVPQDYSEFTLAITGNATLIAQWQNAFKLKQVNKGTPPDYLDGDQFYTKIINPKGYDTPRGDMIEAYLQSNSSGAYFTTNSTPSPVFTGMTTQRQYTLLTTEKRFTENDELKLYVVLNKNNQNIGGETTNTYEYNQSIQWLYISNITDYYDPFDNKKLLYQEITFSSVNDNLNSSGMTIWQKVQHGAIGEGYFFPRIIDGVVDYDPILAMDKGVKAIDLKILGASVPCSLTVIGRPIKAGQINTRVYQPRDLLFSNELSSLPDTLLINSNASNVLYNLQNMIPMNETTYGEWTERFDALADPLKTKNAEGVLGTNLTETQATNPDKIPFWDSGLNFNPKGIYNTKQIRKFIYQDPTYTFAPFGTANFDYSLIKDSSFHQILNYNRYTHSAVSLLPFKVNEYTKFTLNNLPIVGKIASFFDLGLPIRLMGQKDTTLIPKITQLNGFMDQNLYDILQASLWNGQSAGKGFIPFDLFRNETEDQVGALLGSNSMTTGALLFLTDKIKTNAYKLTGEKVGTFNFTTLDICQKKQTTNYAYPIIPILSQENDFTFIALDKDEAITFPDPNMEFNPTPDGTLESYVIDFIGLQTIGKVDWKITAYSENPYLLTDNITAFQCFQGQWQTFAKFVNNMTAWFTPIKTSALDYDLLEDTTFFYPQAVLPPDPFIYKEKKYLLMPSFGNIGTIQPRITTLDKCSNTTNILVNTNKLIFIQEVDISNIDPTITTPEQFKNAYASIKIPNQFTDTSFYMKMDFENQIDPATWNNTILTVGDSDCNLWGATIKNYYDKVISPSTYSSINLSGFGNDNLYIPTSSLGNNEYLVGTYNAIPSSDTFELSTRYDYRLNVNNTYPLQSLIAEYSFTNNTSKTYTFSVVLTNDLKLRFIFSLDSYININNYGRPYAGSFYNKVGNSTNDFIFNNFNCSWLNNTGNEIEITLIPRN